MNKLSLTFRRLGLKLAMLALLVLPAIAGAQIYFTDTESGDVNAGFRKMGTFQEAYEMVAYLGNITNFLALPAGNQIIISNYTSVQLSNMCPNGYGNLQWSVFSSFSGPTPWTNSLGIFPAFTCWYTVPRTNVNVQTTPVNRFAAGAEPSLSSQIINISDGANAISQELGTTNVNNNTLVVLEPIAYDVNNLFTTHIGDPGNPALGDFGGSVFSWSVENITSNNFTSATVSDFYQNVPNSTKTKGPFIDPITYLTNGPAYYVGYFTLNPDGSMTFRRAFSAMVTTVTNGFAPLKVVFTNTAAGNITNWVWNFGDGTIITNTTGGNVTNTYAAGGAYTVTLTVYGPGGSSTITLANNIVASPTPNISAVNLAGGQFVFSGTNCPAGVQYRILISTNVALPLASWIPVLTNNFKSNGSFSSTNATGTSSGFYRLVSP